MQIRPYRPLDAACIVRLFHETVRQVNRRHYTQAEVEAWSPEPPDAGLWDRRMSANLTLVAEETGICGFIEMTGGGHVEMLFCRADRIGAGIGRALYGAVEDVARQRGMTRLTAHVSITARPFFERQGFALLSERRVERRGVVLVNFAMAKALPPQP